VKQTLFINMRPLQAVNKEEENPLGMASAKLREALLAVRGTAYGTPGATCTSDLISVLASADS
jgi:hypothetical protein